MPRKAHNPDDLIDVGYQLFTTKGYHGTSIRDVAKAAGIGVGSLYNHFADKEALFAAVMHKKHPFIVVQPALEQVEADTLEGYLQAVARALTDLFEDDPALLNLMFIELVEFNSQNTPEVFASFLPHIQQFAEHAYALGADKHTLAPERLFRTVMSLTMGNIIADRFLKSVPGQQPVAIEQFIHEHLTGILKPEAK